MTTFDLHSIKDMIVGSIKTYVNPQQTSYDSSISLYSCGSMVTQTFIPYSSSIGNALVYVSNTIGNATSIVVTVYSGSIMLKTSTFTPIIGWNTVAVNVGNLVTKKAGSIVISGTPSIVNDVFLGKADTLSYYHGNAGTFNIAFSLTVRDFVYSLYPIKRVESDDIPVIVADIVSRPRTRERYINADYLWYEYNVRVEVYSKYTDETDNLASAVDRGMVKDRKSFPNVRLVTPQGITEIGYVKPEVFNRNVLFKFEQLINRQ